jgi:alkanesulfonate monooxygenase SsuD/methylene tetrahydromethanopterin reductase-like flavin-dependent oxidoreductase (luciferase family)
MKFGLQFFPDVRPEDKSPSDYFSECLELVEASEPLGYTHVRTVEHYFHHYGGYSPSPIVFLTAASQRTKHARLITGAVIPAFNNPLKMAGEIAMLDGISNGRVDVGFARAFLPHEFRTFGISPNESVARYREGIEQVDLLLTQENVSHHGQFHSFDNVTSLPRTTQTPRPKFFIAATFTPESFEYAGKHGYSVMVNPIAAMKLRELLQIYRDAYRAAGHSGDGEVLLATHMFVDSDSGRARAIAEPQIDFYFKSLVEVTQDWASGATSSGDYKGYDKKIEAIKNNTFDKMLASGSIWVGNPKQVRDTIATLNDAIGGFEIASLQLNFHTLPLHEAMRSLKLFAREVMPAFSQTPALA